LAKVQQLVIRPFFEPIDEFKGDIARMYSTLPPVMKIQLLAIIMLCLIIPLIRFYHSLLNQLLAWNNQDPVNPREIARNNAIYARQKNNRHNPQYVNAIWKIEAR
jgi:endonuclease I